MSNKFARVAVATKEGLAVSEHFGHAKRFLIYQLENEQYALLEERHVAHYCHGNTGDQVAMQDILKTLEDCDAVLVAKIGDGPSAKLAKIDVVAIADNAWERIDDALAQLSVFGQQVPAS